MSLSAPVTRPALSPDRVLLRALGSLLIGAGLGSLTSFGQGWVGITLNAFVNSVSAWLVLPFFAGALMESGRRAALLGFLACGSELAGYYTTAHLRGLAAGGGIVIFWLACAALGGTLLGAAGNLWRSSAARLRGLGASVLAASFLSEGLWSYAHALHYYTAAVLWISIGLSLAVILNRGSWRDIGWLALTVPAALVGEVALTMISSQPF
jgi:hypothetical protein